MHCFLVSLLLYDVPIPLNYFVILVYNPSAVDVNIRAENLSASSGVHQVDNDSLEITTLFNCVSNYEASNGRAEKYAICNHHYHNKRYIAFRATTMDKQCKYTHK